MISRLRFIPVLLVVLVSVPIDQITAQKMIPQFLQIQGRLIEDKNPITVPQKVTIRIIEGGNATQHSSSGKVLYSETTTVTPDATGTFTVVLGDEPDAGQKFKPNMFSASTNYFIEISRYEKNKQKVILPRQKIVSVAYSFQTLHAYTSDEAEHASEADHATKADQALNAVKADRADVADRAIISERAMKADVATTALQADQASNSNKAQFAENALTADRAKVADKAMTADKAQHATLAEQALKADEATRAQIADRALHAAEASNADRAVKAEEAERAKLADQSTRSLLADKAANADQAIKAITAQKASDADHASKADEATKALYAERSLHATNADHAIIADTAKKAEFAVSAITADRATKALSADKAAQADNAINADNATSANFADEAMKATVANQAKRASRADTAQVALRLGGIEADDIVTRPLKKNDIAAGVITTGHIAQSSITAQLIKDGTITGIKIAKGSLTGDLFKDASIPQGKIQPLQSARKLKTPDTPPLLDSVDVTGNLSVSGNFFHRFGTIYTPLIRSDGYIFSRFMSADGILFALKGSVSGSNGTAVEGNVQNNIGSSFLASGFGDMFRGQKIPQFSGDPIIFRISNRADIETRNTANQLIYSFIADSSHPVLTIGGPTTTGTFIVSNALGQEGVRLSGGDTTESAQLSVQGSIIVKGKELRVRDYAEVFELENKNVLQPGQVVVIDDEVPGRLKLATKAYDKSVAGVISGGDASSPGVMLGVREDGSTDKPVALAGRVYCYADASYGEIKPGDLITTSQTPGHAMRVTKFDEAQGAIIGKAMQGLKEGRGKILILVTLQ